MAFLKIKLVNHIKLFTTQHAALPHSRAGDFCHCISNAIFQSAVIYICIVLKKNACHMCLALRIYVLYLGGFIALLYKVSWAHSCKFCPLLIQYVLFSWVMELCLEKATKLAWIIRSTHHFPFATQKREMVGSKAAKKSRVSTVSWDVSNSIET